MARLHRPMKRSEAATDSSEGDAWAATLFELSRVIATADTVESLLVNVLDIICSGEMAVDAGIVWLHDAATGRLVAEAARGYSLKGLNRIYLRQGQTVVGRAFHTGQTQRLVGPTEVEVALGELESKDRQALLAATEGDAERYGLACIPLVNDIGIVGVMQLEVRKPSSRLSDNHMDMLSSIGELVALALHSVGARDKDRAQEVLGEANRLKAELISILAHEMRTPLTSIKGYSTALLMEEANFGPETQREFLQIIDEECDVLQDLIRDLLESSVIDAGLLQLALQPVMLARLAEDVVEELGHHSSKHRVLVDIPASFPIIDADPDRVSQVLRNLIDNAMKYSPSGGLVVVRGTVEEDEVVVSVSDQGMGIAPEDLNRLFERFFRAQSGLSRHVVGSGLGLPISRAIVESHGGRIWAESQVGEGSTFYFTLRRQRMGDPSSQRSSE